MSQEAMRKFSTEFKETVVLRLRLGHELRRLRRSCGSGGSCFTNGGAAIAGWARRG